MQNFLAYIDGGSGTMALQLIIAAFLSGVYAFHNQWARLKQKFTKKAPVKLTEVQSEASEAIKVA